MSVDNPILKFFLNLLYPLALLWDGVYRFRRFLYNYDFFKSEKFQVPIISVGNLTFGGTGKTPFTIWLSEYLNEKNKKVMVLSRGYKGKLENSSGILRSGKRLGFNPFEYGDEALLLVRRLKNAVVVVGKNRKENLEFYFDKELPDVVLLDDGHQHLKLKRNLNIVLFDALMAPERYKVAPLGYMREGFSALKDADLIVIGRASQVNSDRLKDLKGLIKKHCNPGVKFSLMDYRPTGFFNSSYELSKTKEQMQGKKVICLAGIASPESFFNLVESIGADVIERLSFPDHYFFEVEEVKEIIDRAHIENAYVVTTEKDIVKIRRIIDDPSLLYLEIQVDFLSGKEEALEIISQAIEN
ncbi:MAG: tetraacyldisaccharide 4'-kinase [Bacteriovoracaceae bacterium]|nr:tetraacyldisaccharide 4'-kinase [Bacteriovoracaceae bacterium]